MAVETSIVIRTLNEAKHLGKLMEGIRRQNYRDWEIVLVDSGSTDGTLEIADRYGANIYHIGQAEFTFGRSLNIGCQNARGKYLAFASGHVWPITNNWLGNLIEPFEHPLVAMVYGRQRGTDASRLPELRDLNTQFGLTSHILVDEPKGNNANAAIRRDLWLSQPFDETLPGLEDVDWARKVERNGYHIYYAADAAVYHLHEESLRKVYHRYHREAIATKRMFPHNKFTWWDMFRGLPYFVVRDFLYAARVGKPGKILQIPGARLAQFLGIYRGLRYQNHQIGGIAPRLNPPETSQQVVVEAPGIHGFKVSKLPQLQPHEVVIQVAFVGVCGTDLAVATGRVEDNRNSKLHFPWVPGHEYSGIVIGRGSKVRRLRRGHRIVGEYAGGRGLGAACAGGGRHLFTSSEVAGAEFMEGAYADYLVKDARYVHKLPPDVPLRYGPSIASLAVCLSALDQLAPERDRHACLVGAGPMGNLCAQILKSRGLQVTAVDSNPRWLSLLNRYDVDTLAELGPLGEYDYVIDTSGTPHLQSHLLNDSKPGTVLLLVESPCASGGKIEPVDPTGNSKVISTPTGTVRQNWKEAFSLVQKGVIRLDDHAAVVESFQDYQKVWESLQSRKLFGELLRVSDELEAL